MSILWSGQWRPSWKSALLAAVVAIHVPAAAQEPVPAETGFPAQADQLESPSDDGLRFSFAATPWRDVVKWLADESELALHVDSLPTGSFTYSDPSPYTHQGAIDRVNLFLLPQGFTLVRSGKLLSVINLGDSRSMQQLDALADFVTVAELAGRENHDVVKCIFPLGELDAEDAVQELSALNLMTTPAVFSKTNQLMITDTAGKLLNVKAILDAFQPSQMDNGTVVKSFALKHVDAEDVLVVARPHLGLATGEMIGIDVSISADTLGKNIFVTGIEDKVKLIEGLIASIDQPKQNMSTESGELVLKAHLVAGGNVETVYNVLQTLLAGKSIRLSMDEEAGSVVALAPPAVQAEIEKTVLELQASDAQFAVIPLKSIDPYFAVSLLEEMLDLPDAFDDPDEIDPDAPKIDADPGNMRLFVRGKKSDIEQIREIVEGLDTGSSTSSDEVFRVLPLKGKQAEQILETAVKFWRGANPVIVFRSSEPAQPAATERVVTESPSATHQGSVGLPKVLHHGSAGQSAPRTLTADQATSGQWSDQRWLTANTSSKAPAIRCQVTARGLLLQSDDSEALDQFEEHLRIIAGPVDSMPSPPIVFYLKYTKADDALRMLAELLDGGDAADEFEGGTLVNGFVSSGSSLLGSLVTSRDGTTTMTSGSMTVLADTRLNRLIAQGTAAEIERIENYLKIIDKDNSITAIETYGTAHVIELVNSRASDVAQAIRDAFAGRVVAGGTSSSGGQAQPGSPQAQRQAAEAAAAAAKAKAGGDDARQNNKKGNEKQAPASRTAKNLEPKITVAVHEPSNSLIVTAPEQLFKEVEKLALSIDSRGEQLVEVVAPMNGDLIELVLQQVLLGETAATSRPQPSRSPSPPPAAPPASLRSKSGR